MSNLPRRRGRPPMSTPAAEALTEKAAVNPSRRRRRASTGGMKLKLSVPERAGFKRRWFNADTSRLAEAEELAYDYVTDPTIKSDVAGEKVGRIVGKNADGSPQIQFLMETPVEEYQYGQEEKEEIHRAVDQAIAEGRDINNRVQDGYGQGQIQVG